MNATTITVGLLFCILALHGANGAATKSRPTAFSLAFQDMKKLTELVESIFDEFIARHMQCTDKTTKCREEMTSLRLTRLPRFENIDVGEDFEINWPIQFRNQVQGLQVFSKILTDVAESMAHPRYQDSIHGAVATPKGVERIRSISVYLNDFIDRLRDNMQLLHCVDVGPAISDAVRCEICQQPELPSRPLEIVRNYQFLLQLRDYFDSFNKTIMYFVIVPPERRC